MKIGFLTTYFYPFKGGVESNILYSAQELSKKHEIHIFTSDRKYNQIIKNKEEKLGNINIHRSKTLFRYKYYFAFYPKLLKNILKYDLDIIHVHSIGFPWHDICIVIKKIISQKTKFVITPHGPFMTRNNYPRWQKFLKQINTSIIRLTNNIYDLVIQVNPYQSKWLVNEYHFNKSKIKYIPNGIDKFIFKNYDTKEVYKKYNLNNKFIISYIGRLHEYKGIQDVIKILPQIIKKHPNLLFMIIGQDAGYYNTLKELVSKLELDNNVLFLLDCNDKDKNAILELSEIFLMPSEWEAFGITILEAMAKENAIISTKTEGGKFLINKENGLLYNFNDIKQLEKSLVKLVIDNKTRKNMQKNNIEKAKKFTWDKIAIQLEEEYNKLI